jgi:hypothetical protein
VIKSSFEYRFKFAEKFASFNALGHCGEFCYALWAIVADLVMRYGPLRQIWLYVMGHCGNEAVQ